MTQYKYKSSAKTLWLSDPKFFIIINRNPVVSDFKSAILHQKEEFKPIYLEYEEKKTDSEYLEEAEAIYIIKKLGTT